MREFSTSIARIENQFIFNAQYQLTAREQKVILYLVSKVDPTGKQFGTQVVPIKEIKSLVMSKRSGSFYEMEEFSKRIFEKKIVFDSAVEVGSKNKKKKM